MFIIESEWVSDCSSAPIEQFFSYIMARTNDFFRWDDVHIVLYQQHTWLDFYIASSLKQQSAARHVSPLEHIILIPTQSLATLNKYCVFSGEAANTNFIVYGLTWLEL